MQHFGRNVRNHLIQEPNRRGEKLHAIPFVNFHSVFRNSRLRNVERKRYERQSLNIIVKVKQDFNGSCSQRN